MKPKIDQPTAKKLLLEVIGSKPIDWDDIMAYVKERATVKNWMTVRGALQSCLNEKLIYRIPDIHVEQYAKKENNPNTIVLMTLTQPNGIIIGSDEIPLNQYGDLSDIVDRHLQAGFKVTLELAISKEDQQA